MFGSFLFNLLAFITTIGILVTIHEFGHYWVARKAGVKVLRFSIGFGKPIWKKIAGADKTEYVIAMIPLGGFVKMLDEREGAVDKKELHRAFNRQNVWKRIAIVAAGPLFNFLFAIFAYFLVHLIGIESLHPYVGEPVKQSIAAKAGFANQDRIIAINGEKVMSATETRLIFIDQYLKTKQLKVEVETAEGRRIVRMLNLSQSNLLAEEGDVLKKIGLTHWFPPHHVKIAKVVPNSAAERANLKAKDQIVAANGQAVTSLNFLSEIIGQHANKNLNLTIKRAGIEQQISVTPDEKIIKGETKGSLGVMLQGYLSKENRAKLFFDYKYGAVDSFILGITKTWQMSALTLKLMGKLVTGEASIKNISGPITIAKIAGDTASVSLVVFISFLAIVSISLGVLNLLPVPMLDGGHLLYYAIELIKGSPVSERVEAIGFQIGIVLVVGLMMLALYNDITRLMH